MSSRKPPTTRDVVEEAERDVRDRREVGGRALGSVELEEQVARQAEREEVDRRAADDLVGAEGDREERVEQAHQRRRRAMPIASPSGHAPGHVGAPDGEERAREHHPLEADVHDARALGEQPAERGEDERSRVAEHRREQRAPDDDRFEVVDARAGREVADREPEHAGCDRVAADAALAADPRADADREREEADHDRSDRAPNLDRRQRDERGEDADDDPGPGDALASRAGAASSRLGSLLRAVRFSRRSASRTMTSAPTKRTISPWMMIARLEARSGGKYAGSRLRDAVPVSSAAKSSAARPTPTAVFRPSSATAMPMKPTVEPWICVVSSRNSQPTMSSAPARPAKSAGDRHREEVVAARR